MISFVNAKINLGLRIIRRRVDGYHDIQTIFYPVGAYNGTPDNPDPFCDILEITASSNADELAFEKLGRKYNCPKEKDLVWKAAQAFFKATGLSSAGYRITLDKHLPDGAGLGGGSADGSFVLRMLNDLTESHLDDNELIRIAATLGADCPFFILNRPVYATGIGEEMTPIHVELAGKWLILLKPDVYVSTKEAFAGVTPCEQNKLPMTLPAIEDWKEVLVNDFEASIFPAHPRLEQIKQALYDQGAIYASMSGSGSSLFGIYADEPSATSALQVLKRQFPDGYAAKIML